MYTDTAAMTFAVTGLAFLPAVLRYRLLELKPVAWATVVRGMNDPVVVIDPSGQDRRAQRGRSAALGPASCRDARVRYCTDIARWPELLARLRVMPEQGESSFELRAPSSEPRVGFRRQDLAAGWSRQSFWGGSSSLRDITEHKCAEEERVRMLSAAARAEARAANRAKDGSLPP